MLLGRNTSLLTSELPLREASNQYPGWYAVVLDPERQGGDIVAGSVKAVSKTRDGAFRALYHMGTVDRRTTVLRLP